MSKFLGISIVTAGAIATAGLLALPLDAQPGREDEDSVHIEQPAGTSGDQLPPAQSPTGMDPLLLRGFAPGENNWNPGHRGADLLLTHGQPVRAATDGAVIYAARLNDRSLVSIEHSGGLRTTYEPVEPSVKRGDTVEAGDVIGTIQVGHCGDSACLHWGAKWGTDGYIDPMSLLNGGPVRLYE